MAKRRKKKWIPKNLKKNQLHRDLGVKKGQKIPHSKLRTAAKKKGKVGQRARFALAMRSVNRKKRRRKRK